MEYIKISKENAQKAYDKAPTAQFKELIETLVGKENLSTYRDPKEWIKTIADLQKATRMYPLPSRIEDKEKLIMKIFNMQEDGTEWKPNWADAKQQKWRIWVFTHKDESSPLGFRLSFYAAVCDHDLAGLGCRLYFKDEETARYVGKYFLDFLTDSIVY